MTKKTLQQLYTEHSGKVSDKWSIYLVEYGRIFGEYRDKPVTLLEIGIQNGGSLEIWSKFFANAQKLVGCDINPDCARLVYEDPHVAVVVGDANSDAVQSIVLQHAPVFDVIIDDGSHSSSDIVKSFAKYFPHLADGGVFVAEDLHCSYWAEYEGGLLDPFSSIAFFKLLADVIHHEHWGVARARTEILTGFFHNYGFAIDETVLAQIHSVEFINSMCVVKRSPPESNRLGKRLVAGTDGSIVSNPLVFNQTDLTPPSQTNNPWSTRLIPPDQSLLSVEKKLCSLEQKLAQSLAENEALLASTSWRVSAPLRWAAEKIRKTSRIRKT